ncbi:hypothetical protein GEMRC1_010003 [Eukaryota sp. GEM-RC1]
MLSSYEVLNVIGEGSYGVVLRCLDKESNSVVAIKRFKNTEDDEAIERISIRECRMLRMLQHENVVKLLKAFKHKGRLHMVFNYADYNMLEVLESHHNGLPINKIRWYLYQLIRALSFIHQQGVLHRDIKLENLLVTKDDLLYLCDFGFARKASHSDLINETLTEYVATRWYRSPSLLLGLPYNNAVDMWATGCVLAELATGRPLFAGDSDVDQLSLILSTLGPLPPCLIEVLQKNPRFRGYSSMRLRSKDDVFRPYLPIIGQSGVDLMQKMLDLDESRIITASEALSHPFFEGLHENSSDNLSKSSRGKRLKRSSRSKPSLHHDSHHVINQPRTNHNHHRLVLPSVSSQEANLGVPSKTFAHRFKTTLHHTGLPPAPMNGFDPYGFHSVLSKGNVGATNNLNRSIYSQAGYKFGIKR